MSLRQISLNNFRNIQPVTLDFHSKHNIIFGNNASGKTSLLEAINFLCEGRSFKTHLSDQCINHDASDFLIFGQFNDHKVGLARQNKKTVIRVNNETVSQVSNLAKKTPVRVIDSNSFNLLTGSPNIRREYLDWYLFHVEHTYIKTWSEHRHALKQRNALLKQKKNLEQLDYWDELLAQYCETIYGLRTEFFKKVSNMLLNDFSELLFGMDISIQYKPGWDNSLPLLAQLKKRRHRDLQYGYTSLGSHRDDFILFDNNEPVQQVLSRGQLKRLSTALLLSQIKRLSKISDKACIVLIDDISAELDETTVLSLLNHLDKLAVQLFISNISASPLLLQHFQEYRLFHVEHGMIKPVRNT